MPFSDFNTKEEKERQTDKAFLFIVSFEEFIPYLDDLEIPEEDKDAMLEEYKLEGEDSDFYSIIDDESQEIADVITKIIKERGSHTVQPKKGDVIRLAFIRTRQFGTYFWDGERAILPEEEESSDFYCVPSVLSIPDFPLDYWDDCGFVGWSSFGDFYYDTSDMKLEECKVPHLGAKVSLYRDMNSDFYVLMFNGEDKEETMRRFVSTGRCFGAFREDGSCYGKLEDSGETETTEKISNYIFQHEGYPKNTIYVDYLEEENSYSEDSENEDSEDSEDEDSENEDSENEKDSDDD
jgi:hypothetical protein